MRAGALVGSLAALIACWAISVLALDEPVWLVTDGEAELAPPPVTRGVETLPKDGPLIRVLSPSVGVEVVSPFPVEVQFEPRPGGAPVEMESLKVTYLKVFAIDITDRIRPHVSENRLFVREAKIPQGRHRLKITIADRGGKFTAEILEVNVR